MVTVTAAYLVTYALPPQEGFWINDNECKFIQLQGLIRTQYRDFSIPWPGRELDPGLAFNPLADPFGYIVDGRLYAFTPPLFPLLASFPYRIWGQHGLYVLPLLGGLLTVPGVWYLAGNLPSRRLAQPLAFLLVGLGTPVWFYSLTFWEHTPAVCLTTWSVACFLRFLSGGSVRHLAASAALCGLAIYFRDELYLLGAVLAFSAVLFGGQRRWSAVAWFVAVLVVTVVPLWGWQWAALGHPLGHHSIHHSPLEAGLLTYLRDRWEVVRHLLINGHGSLPISIAISAVPLALWLTYPVLPQRVWRRAVPIAAGVATAGGVVALAGHLTAFSPIWWLMSANGLFCACPVLILAFLRLRDDGTRGTTEQPTIVRSSPQRVLWLIVSLYTLVFVLLLPWLHSAGIHWGARLLLLAYPLLGALAASTAAQWWAECRRGNWVGKALVCAGVGVSVAAQLYSLHLLAGRKEFSNRLNDEVAQRPEQVIVARHPFVPQYLSRCFYDKQIFLCRDRQDMQRLSLLLRRAGVDRVLVINAWRPEPGGVYPTEGTVTDGRLRYISIHMRSVPLR